jgi:hypothetical protein
MAVRFLLPIEGRIVHAEWVTSTNLALILVELRTCFCPTTSSKLCVSIMMTKETKVQVVTSHSKNLMSLKFHAKGFTSSGHCARYRSQPCSRFEATLGSKTLEIVSLGWDLEFMMFVIYCLTRYDV